MLSKIFTHLKLCVATATHNFKWVKKINQICLIWDQNTCKLWSLNNKNNNDLIS